MRSFIFNITCTYDYYGYPQAERHYVIDGDYMSAKLNWFGNQGFEPMSVAPKRQKNNGYFWESNSLLRAFYSESSTCKSTIRSLREGSKIRIEICDDVVTVL